MKKLIVFFLASFPLINHAQVVDSIATDSFISSNEEKIYELFDVTEKANFLGGETAFQHHLATRIIYPHDAFESGAAGIIVVSFVVNLDGTVSDVKTIGKPKGYGLEEEAIRVIETTNRLWLPAKMGDTSERMRFKTPIKFEIISGG